MLNIALIGAGNLGRRHLEGLLKLPEEKSIWVVDASPASLEEARRLPLPQGNASPAHTITFHTSISRLPEKLDYAVIATSSNVRLAVMEELLEGRTVKSMLLEKVLFQRRDDYTTAAVLIARKGVRTWVNTARRAMDIHKSIKRFFEGEVITYFDVRGGEWGLGCNGIHFIDFLSFLAGSAELTVSAEELDRRIVTSKRPGFGEFTGTLRGRVGAAEFALNATRGSMAPLLVTIRSKSKACILDESCGQAFLRDSQADPVWRDMKFSLPFISDLSTTIADAILTKGECDLPDFATSSALHLPFIDALADFSVEFCGGTPGLAPIT